MEKEHYLFKEECYVIRGAIFEVYREMGCGYLEAVYQECLEKEFELRKIPYVSQEKLNLSYKGFTLNQTYKPDFICCQSVILELKSAKEIHPLHQAQILNYLKATNIKVGVIINFGSYPKVTIERYIL